jgi:hypothetical protein
MQANRRFCRDGLDPVNIIVRRYQLIKFSRLQYPEKTPIHPHVFTRMKMTVLFYLEFFFLLLPLVQSDQTQAR